ncbi:MAG: TIGR00730 family Rossman fold protein [Parcubacteria group bacterium]|nr:TIGR00730 family Rossman fold protein [Parcubacteria group bacterium]
MEFRLQTRKRLDLIQEEFENGFEFLYPFKREITIFGSARFKEDHKYYVMACALAKQLGEEGYTIITGGGPGIMEAANRGAQEAGAPSVGLNIELPREQRVNPYVDKDKSMGFHYFFSRKVMLSAAAQAYVAFPGGFGTMDELFEMITLIQTKKMEAIPIILVGHEFWQPLLDWIKAELADDEKTISPEDLDLFTLVESNEEAMEIIRTTSERKIF